MLTKKYTFSAKFF